MKKLITGLVLSLTILLTGCTEEAGPFDQDFTSDQEYSLQEIAAKLDEYHLYVSDYYEQFSSIAIYPEPANREDLTYQAAVTDLVIGGWVMVNGNHHFKIFKDIIEDDIDDVFNYSSFYTYEQVGDKIKFTYIRYMSSDEYLYAEVFANMIDGKLYYEVYSQEYNLLDDEVTDEQFMIFYEDHYSLYKKIDYARQEIMYQEMSTDTNQSLMIKLNQDGMEYVSYANKHKDISYSANATENEEWYWVKNEDFSYRHYIPNYDEEGTYEDILDINVLLVDGWTEIAEKSNSTMPFRQGLYLDNQEIMGDYYLYIEESQVFGSFTLPTDFTNDSLSLRSFGLESNLLTSNVLDLQVELKSDMLDYIEESDLITTYTELKQEFINDFSKDSIKELAEDLKDAIEDWFQN